jgi:hypothetical protein
MDFVGSTAIIFVIIIHSSRLFGLSESVIWSELDVSDVVVVDFSLLKQNCTSDMARATSKPPIRM